MRKAKNTMTTKVTDKIYIVMKRKAGCDFSDEMVCASHERSRSECIKDKLNALEDFNDAFNKRIKPEFEYHWTEANPEPTKPSRPWLSDEYVRLNKLSSFGVATPEDQEFIKQEEKKHQKNLSVWGNLNQEYLKLLRDYDSRKNAAQKEWILDNYNPPHDLHEVTRFCSHLPSYGTTYYVDEVELFD